MAAAVAPIYGVQDKIPEFTRTTPAGWVGSVAAKRGDFVTIDSSGYINVAVASGNPVVTTTKVGLLVTDMASTDAVASANALACQYRAPGDSTELELSLVSNSDTLITPANADVGTIIGLYRRSTGEYCADRNGTVTFHVTAINLTRGTVKGTIVAPLRLK